MKQLYQTKTKILSGVMLVMLLVASRLNSQVTLTFTYTGGPQTFTVPPCVASISVDARGAKGGDAVYPVNPTDPGGLGGQVTCVYPVTSGQVLNIFVGGLPYNGGGNGSGPYPAFGGGASDIRINGVALTDRVIVAGGGGGGGNNCGTMVEPGGAGGGLIGGAGSQCGAQTSPAGMGGTQSAGGASSAPGTVGTFGIGGNGGSTITGAGGGGGGYYGGGGAGYGGGGGGSSYTDANATSVVHTQSVQNGNGQIIITYIFNGAGITVSPSSTAICSGSGVTLNAAGVLSYTWLPTSGFTGSNTASITHSPSATTQYTVKGTNSLGCISTSVVPVTVYNVSGVTATPNTNSVCLGQTVSITAGGASSYTISGGITSGVSFTPAATAVYTVTGNNSCGTYTTATTITVSALPVTAVSTSTLLCSATPATLTAGGATTYTWNPGASTNTTYVVNPTASSVYTLSGKTGNCLGITTISLTIKSLPTLSITPSSTAICIGNSVSLVVAGTATSYVWSTGQSGTSISSAPALLTLFTVTGTNTNNCTNSASQVIYVNPNPTVSAIASDIVVCAGGPSTLTATGADTYTWSNNAVGSSVVVNPVSSTVYTVTGSYTTGCNASTVVAVALFIPTISVTGNTAVCTGSHVTIGAMGASTYTWLNNNTQGANISVAPAANTIYTVTGAVNDVSSGVTCNATNTLQVTVNANPTITAASNRANNAMCIGESIILTASGAGANGTYTWTGGAGTTVSPSITATPIADQTYGVAGKDENGCRSVAGIQVSVSGCVGIAGNASNAVNLAIYPNPNNGEFTISADQAILLQVINELGQQVKVVTLTENQREAKITGLSNGVYFITGKNANSIVREKIIVAK